MTHAKSTHELRLVLEWDFEWLGGLSWCSVDVKKQWYNIVLKLVAFFLFFLFCSG